MAEEDQPHTLAPPAVVALKEEAAGSAPHRVHMERTISQDIREEREDLKEAAEQSLNVIMHLDLDGNIRWVSPSWTKVIGTTPEEVEGKPIADLLIDNNNQFADTVESLRRDDSRSQIARFSVHMGPMSDFHRKRSRRGEEEEPEASPERSPAEEDKVLNLEAQGIMMYDRTTGAESHVSLVENP